MNSFASFIHIVNLYSDVAICIALLISISIPIVRQFNNRAFTFCLKTNNASVKRPSSNSLRLSNFIPAPLYKTEWNDLNRQHVTSCVVNAYILSLIKFHSLKISFSTQIVLVIKQYFFNVMLSFFIRRYLVAIFFNC